jgi:hypothetical protein
MTATLNKLVQLGATQVEVQLPDLHLAQVSNTDRPLAGCAEGGGCCAAFFVGCLQELEHWCIAEQVLRSRT